MNTNRMSVTITLALALVPAGMTVASAMTEAADACIDALRATGTPDAQAGEVLSSSFSEAGTLVMLKDAGGTVYRCIAYKDGAIGELSVVDAADDGGGAMSGAKSGDSEPGTTEERVAFAKGTSGADLSGSLAPGASRRYILGAGEGQFLDVSVTSQAGGVFYQIFNPDGSFLLDQMSPDKPYRGQLWQSGDHVVEVINRGSSDVTYSLWVGID